MIKKRLINRSGSSEGTPEKMLLENFVSLQKVMLNLSVKLDELTNQLAKLLNLFEISAKTLAEKDFILEKKGKDEQKIIEKLNNLLEQNKTIARGLTLLHEPFPQSPTIQSKEPLQTIQSGINQSLDVDRYQKSIYVGSDGLPIQQEPTDQKIERLKKEKS